MQIDGKSDIGVYMQAQVYTVTQTLITVLVDAERSSRPSVIHPSNSSQRNPGHDLLRLPRLLSLASSFPRWCRSIPWVYKRWRRGKTMPLMMSTASTRSIEAVTKANGNGAQMVPAILVSALRLHPRCSRVLTA
jgi:hypothetical protein